MYESLRQTNSADLTTTVHIGVYQKEDLLPRSYDKREGGELHRCFSHYHINPLIVHGVTSRTLTIETEKELISSILHPISI